MRTLESGENPRTVFRRKHRERGPKRFAYTYADIAALVGKSTQAVRQDASRGKFDPSSLASVIAYVSARISPA